MEDSIYSKQIELSYHINPDWEKSIEVYTEESGSNMMSDEFAATVKLKSLN